MDQIRIGKFIKERRNLKNITQSNLASILGITDRAISKWENGICMPDVGTIPELCKILDITVNDLFSGEIVKMKDYDKKLEENLLDLAKKEEAQNKKMMIYEYVIGFISSITFLVLMFTLSYAVENQVVRIILFIIAFLILIVGVSFALKIETETGYYECKKCHHKYIPSYKSVYFAMHYGTTRYLKCPKCHKKSWNKKVMK
ncbi:MAG: helix-turn-helix transcriptional regulator [bacterium]|nr:helix-turn-helix transcriptional regulator [bacterium]